MKTRSLPKSISKPLFVKILKSRILTFISYWIFQGFFYMNIYEKSFKIMLDIIGTTLIMIVLVNIFNVNIWILLVVSYVIVHTLNMFFNGHFYTLEKFFGFTKVTKKKHIHYIEEMRKRWMNRSCIKFLIAYGSLSRGQLSATSDLDIRAFAGNQVLDIIKSCFWTSVERSHALFAKFPIDIYVVAKLSETKRIRSDEMPLILTSNSDPRKYFNKFKFFDDLKENL